MLTCFVYIRSGCRQKLLTLTTSDRGQKLKRFRWLEVMFQYIQPISFSPPPLFGASEIP